MQTCRGLEVFVKENLFSRSFSVFPNPSSENVSIIHHDSNQSSIVSIKIISITGELIEEKQVSFIEEIELNCSQWAKGIYFISISSAEASSHFKFVKE